MTADHPYVAYAEGSELRTAAAGFLSDGLNLGQRVGYFGWGGSDALRDRANGLAGLDELIRGGTAHVVSLDDHFNRDVAPEPAALVAFWSAATDAAVLAGFTALRVVTDTTPWVQPDKERPGFLRADHLVDRYRLDHPFAQLCAGDSTILDDDALAEIACIHPSSEGVSVPFHVHATLGADLALDGELDAFMVSLLERVISSVQGKGATEELVLDVKGLAFVEHRSLLALQRHAEESGVRSVLLRNPSRVAGRMVELLDLSRVHVEAS
jgi:anti-anti-sigma regulatory factor